MSMVLTLEWASESTTRTRLLWTAASVSESVRVSVDFPTPPFAFMIEMVLCMPLPAAA